MVSGLSGAYVLIKLAAMLSKPEDNPGRWVAMPKTECEAKRAKKAKPSEWACASTFDPN